MSRLLTRRILGALAVVALLVPATAAAASLRITVSPQRVRPGRKYVIKVVGHFRQSELHGTAYLWEFVQFSGGACKPTAKAENTLPHSNLSIDWNGRERNSPFTRIDNWKAGTITGVRHVCAYLYPQVVSLTNGMRPIATADAPFRNV